MTKLLIISLAILLTSCFEKYRYQPDNIVEEAVELGIKAGTGVDVDLSLSTPESGFSPKSVKPLVKIEPK